MTNWSCMAARFFPTIAMDAFEESAHPRGEGGKFSTSGHGVENVTPTPHGAAYHVGKHKLEVSRKGKFVSHTKEGMQGSYDPKISRSVFPDVHESVRKHMAAFGPHPEAGGEEKTTGRSSAGHQIKRNAAASAKVKRMF